MEFGGCSFLYPVMFELLERKFGLLGFTSAYLSYQSEIALIKSLAFCFIGFKGSPAPVISVRPKSISAAGS